MGSLTLSGIDELSGEGCDAATPDSITPDFMFVLSDGVVVVDIKNSDTMPPINAKMITANSTREFCCVAGGRVGRAIVTLSVCCLAVC